MRCARDGFAVLAPNFFFRHPDQKVLNAGDRRYDMTDPESVELIKAALAAHEEAQGRRPEQGRGLRLLPDRPASADLRGRGADHRRGGVVRRRREARMGGQQVPAEAARRRDREHPLPGVRRRSARPITSSRSTTCGGSATASRRTRRPTTSTSTRTRRTAGSTTPCRAAIASRRPTPAGPRSSVPDRGVQPGLRRQDHPLALRMRARARATISRRTSGWSRMRRSLMQSARAASPPPGGGRDEELDAAPCALPHRADAESPASRPSPSRGGVSRGAFDGKTQLPRLIFCDCAALASSATPAHADDVADFYKGKTVTLTVSSSAGGGYDTLARTVARFLGKHVPGNPIVVVRNIAGAGGIVATNFLYNNAEKDGSHIGLRAEQHAVRAAARHPRGALRPDQIQLARHAERRDRHLRGVERGAGEFARRRQDARDHGRRRRRQFDARASTRGCSTRCSGSSSRSSSAIRARPRPSIAMERGEIDGYSSVFYSSPAWPRKPTGCRRRRSRRSSITDRRSAPELAGVPYAPEVATKEDDRVLLDAAFAPLALGRPLRDAARRAGRSPRRHAQGGGGYVRGSRLPRRGDAARPAAESGRATASELQAVIQRIYATPPAVIDRLRKLNTVPR